MALNTDERCRDIVCNKCLIYIYIHISHRSISSEPSSIAGNETVLFILMVTALQQTDQEENRDGSHNMRQLIKHSFRDIKNEGGKKYMKIQQSLFC